MSGDVRVLRAPGDRTAAVGGGAALVGVGLVLLVFPSAAGEGGGAQSPLGAGVAVVLVLAGIVVAWRGASVCTELSEDAMILHDWIGSRSIPRDEITSVTAYGQVEWTTRSGMRESAQVTGLPYRSRVGLTEFRELAIAEIKEWAHLPPGPAPGDPPPSRRS